MIKLFIKLRSCFRILRSDEHFLFTDTSYEDEYVASIWAGGQTLAQAYIHIKNYFKQHKIDINAAIDSEEVGKKAA